MDKRTELVFNGFLALNETQRKKLLDEIDRFQRAGSIERRGMAESIEKSAKNYINFGPAPGGCTCCGR